MIVELAPQVFTALGAYAKPRVCWRERSHPLLASHVSIAIL